jgi:hypothetical protein
VTDDIARDASVRRSAVLFAEALAREREKNTGQPRTPESDREIAEEIGARFFAKDVTPKDEEGFQNG